MESPEYEPGKIFVGGLSWETNEEGMRKHFEQFGAVADCVVMRDAMQPPGIKKNRGFGFVKFEDPSTVDKVVQHPIHTLDNKTIDPKRAQKKSGGKDTDKKVFLGGLASTTTEQDVENYFNTHYGGVTEVVFKVDKTTNRKRG
jgi:RNA-binding protein Musashi